jgi:hypothetical protein
MASEENEILGKMLESLQAERRELDRQAWQVPLAIYGAVGLVVGFVLKADGRPGNGDTVSVMYAFSAVLVLAGLFVLQRLHERRRYRAEQVHAIVEAWKHRYPRIKRMKIDIVCSGKNINKWILDGRDNDTERLTSRSKEIRRKSKKDQKPARNWVPWLFGRLSTTANGFSLLNLLLVVVVYLGVGAVTPLWAQVLFVLALVVIGGLFALLCWFHHCRDQDYREPVRG